jgi:1-phosphofructokinase family hexose kinase
MKIVTLTLNPAFDIHCNAVNFRPYHESIVQITSRDAGGKGVNISRALCSVGCENTAIVVVGDENGEEFCKMLENDGLTTDPISLKGRIRENITLHESENPETRISFGGFEADGAIIDAICEKIGDVCENTVITFTGSLPKGIKVADILGALEDLKARGAKIVIDSRSLSLKELTEFKPWLIKPNKDEIEEYVGCKVSGAKDALKIAEELYSFGIENVMISLGDGGAVLVNCDGKFYAKAPYVDVRSTIGAGDSAVAGFIYGFKMGYPSSKMLALSVAFGTASCAQDGTRPPLERDIKLMEEKVDVVSF